jgi:hypothetical protein
MCAFLVVLLIPANVGAQFAMPSLDDIITQMENHGKAMGGSAANKYVRPRTSTRGSSPTFATKPRRAIRGSA